MADDPTELPPDQAGAPAGEPDVRAEALDDEIARKYDPERLLRVVSRRAGQGASLDHSIRSKYERRFGVDLGHVRVYTGEFAEEFNRQKQAHAVTIGSTGMILMGNTAAKAAGSREGAALLAHELTHVAQARRGLHRSANDGMPLATEEHEAEAEAVEAEELHGAPAAPSGSAPSKSQVEAKQDMLDKIKERVLEMAADAARSHFWRNGLSRRA